MSPQDLSIWLNADVFRGPGIPLTLTQTYVYVYAHVLTLPVSSHEGGSKSLFDADDFVRTCRENLPLARLSLGWTVGNKYSGGYEEKMIMQVRG